MGVPKKETETKMLKCYMGHNEYNAYFKQTIIWNLHNLSYVCHSDSVPLCENNLSH